MNRGLEGCNWSNLGEAMGTVDMLKGRQFSGRPHSRPPQQGVQEVLIASSCTKWFVLMFITPVSASTSDHTASVAAALAPGLCCL